MRQSTITGYLPTGEPIEFRLYAESLSRRIQLSAQRSGRLYQTELSVKTGEALFELAKESKLAFASLEITVRDEPALLLRGGARFSAILLTGEQRSTTAEPSAAETLLESIEMYLTDPPTFRLKQ